jgi:hypothetical protein
MGGACSGGVLILTFYCKCGDMKSVEDKGGAITIEFTHGMFRPKHEANNKEVGDDREATQIFCGTGA